MQEEATPAPREGRGEGSGASRGAGQPSRQRQARPSEKRVAHSKNGRVPAASRQGAASTFTRPLAGGCPGASAPSLAAHLGMPSPQRPSFHTGLLPEAAPSLGPRQGDFQALYTLLLSPPDRGRLGAEGYGWPQGEAGARLWSRLDLALLPLP